MKSATFTNALGLNRTIPALAFIFFLSASSSFAAERADVSKEELPKLQTIYSVTAPKPFGPETPLSQQYYQLLNRYVRYTRPNMRDWPKEPGAKFHKVDGSKEHSVRQNATVAFALAILNRTCDFDEQLGGATRAEIRADAIGLVRYLVVTHTNNFLPAGDGAMWGDHWQSAFWAAYVAHAAWLLWDDLPDETKVMAARMMIHEANRFNERPPDSGVDHDTKAEENGWNSEVIALAGCMLQQHPNAKLWRERAIVYMMNAFSTAADNADETIVDGKRVKDWITTTNIHPDFTLENHHRVHPDYLSTFTLNMRNAVVYEMAGRPIPQGTFHHVEDIFPVLSHLTATNGSFFYVNGQDWWPHRHELPMFVGGLIGLLLKDANAAALEQASLSFSRKMHARFDDGRAFDKREIAYPNVEEELMARYGELYLAHRLFGDFNKPASIGKFQKAQFGAKIFEKGGFVTHHTKSKFTSFAWLNGAMGLIVPADDTWFTAPFERSLTGTILVEGAKDTAPQVEAKNVSLLGRKGDEDGFTFVGKFSRCEGKVEQRLAVVSLPDELVYIEQLVAREDVHVKEIATGTFAVLNEDAKPISQNFRRVWTAMGETTMTGASEHQATNHIWKTSWANLDDKLGVFAQAGGEMAYSENHSYARGRLQQFLIPNYRTNLGPKRAGEIISEAVVVYVPNLRHGKKLDFEMEKIGASGFKVVTGKWTITANLENHSIIVPAEKEKLPALNAVVTRRK